MTILVANPWSPTPGLYLKVDLKPRNAATSGLLRMLIVAPANTTGSTITENSTPVEIDSESHVSALAGVGSLAALMYVAARGVNPTVPIDYVAPTASAGAAASASLTFAGSPSSNRTFRIWVSGRYKDTSWLVGETENDARTRALAKLGELLGKVHATFSADVTDGGITVTAPATGPTGNDVRIRVQDLEGAGGTLTASSATLTGGTTEIDIEDALAAAAGEEFDGIVPAISNASAAATTGNMALLETHLLNYDEGPDARLQQACVGYTGLRTAVAASAQARNEQVIEIMCAQLSESLPCEIAAIEMADRLGLRALYTSYNRIGRELPILPPNDILANRATSSQSDAALNAGVSLIEFDRFGTARVQRAVTTYTINDNGAQLMPTDCNEIDAMFDAGKDLRSRLQTEYQSCFIVRDSDVEEMEDLPERTVQEADVRATIDARVLSYWCSASGRGVMDRAFYKAKMASGERIVRVNADDETQVDLFVPLKPRRVLAKMGLLVAKGA